MISDTPASAFQYRYYIDHEFTPWDIAFGGSRLEGKWKVQVVTADGVVIFEQTVTLAYRLRVIMGGILINV